MLILSVRACVSRFGQEERERMCCWLFLIRKKNPANQLRIFFPRFVFYTRQNFKWIGVNKNLIFVFFFLFFSLKAKNEDEGMAYTESEKHCYCCCCCYCRTLISLSLFNGKLLMKYREKKPKSKSMMEKIYMLVMERNEKNQQEKNIKHGFLYVLCMCKGARKRNELFKFPWSRESQK